MNRRLGLLSLFLLSPCMAQIPETSSQLLVVTTADWSNLHGSAQRYERRGHDFHKVGPPFRVVVGQTGLGWGRGIESGAAANEPLKQEGDGKAPAGAFELGTAFGYESTATTRLPYLPLTPAIECVDDAHSAHYNELTDGASAPRDWKSSEQMRRSDELYHYGVFVKHNSPAVANQGSCIFLHIWESKDIGTVGCTAMDRSNILMLLAWFDPKRHPLLIQLPVPQYLQYRSTWNLPRL
jgi:L,D-peptidoglycan transpeptidase YkuD (ErfK/YbiS/YcfS/YnhG family)